MSETARSRTMPSEKKCPQCGAPLPAGVLDGLCPACLLKQGVAETGPEAVPFQPPSVEEVARLFPQLEILAFIGKGGMGAVYKARQPALDRFVALKILPPQVASGPGFAERFNREARALAKLTHPHIVAVHEFGQVNGLPFFIMEFVDGLNLRQLERAGKLSPREALQIVPQICEALQFAHDEGIVHRDIKPENILLDKKGRVKIADFGIAKIMGRESAVDVTETKGAIGTPHYMAPEQMEKPETVDHRADIFSLGVVFYEMLTGELPLGKFAPPSRKLGVDVRLDEVVLRALEKEPERRYQQVSEVKTRVETIASSPVSASASPTTRAEGPLGTSISLSGNARANQARLALGLFLAGTLGTLLLMTISFRHEFALIFGSVALVMALVFGLLSWRERLGKVIVLVILAIFVGLGITVVVLVWPPLFFQKQAVLQEQAMVEKERAAQRAILQAIQERKRKAPEPWGNLLRADLTFGPVIERVLPAQRDSFSFIDFESGEIFGHPPGSESDVRKDQRSRFKDWISDRGLDVGFVTNSTSKVAELIGFDLGLFPFASERIPAGWTGIARFAGITNIWDEMNPEILRETVGELLTNQHHALWLPARLWHLPIAFRTREGTEGLLQVSGLANDPRGVKIRYKLVQRTANAPTNAPLASVETWSPNFPPGEKPDFDKLRQEAKDLMDRAGYEETLQRYIWFHNHSLEYEPSAGGGRLISVLTDWVELGRRYPKAKQALIELRDAKAREFTEGRGYFNLFMEIQNINQYLGDDDSTYYVFKSIKKTDAALAQQCYEIAEGVLVRGGEYALCLSYIGAPQAKFETIRRYLEMDRQREQQQVEMRKKFPLPAGIRDMSASSKKYSEDRFIGQTRQLIEVLVGVGRRADAEKIRDQAVALFDNARLKLAISDAEENVRKTLASPRPAQPETRPSPVSRGTSAGTNSTRPSAFIETWSPPLAAGEKPDLEKMRQEANDLMNRGQYEQALQRHIWYHNHALEYEPSLSGVRLSFVLSDWIELGRRYPKAKQALIEIRDAKTREFAAGRGYSALFSDVSSINSYLQTNDATYSLFQEIERRDPALARQCYSYAEDVLVDKGQFELCLRHLGEPQKRFESIRDSWERMTAMEKRMEESYQRYAGTNSPFPLPSPSKHHDRYFVSQTRRLIEILVGAGRKDEAERIHDQAVAALNVPELQSAVSDAKEKIRSKPVRKEKK